jgi:hypothetical protein|tara:strand:- start:1116 stop:1247 length:132 start_codon:yes stop_codon:yes gene_type:complete
MNKVLNNIKRLQKLGNWNHITYAPYHLTIKQLNTLKLNKDGKK